MPLRRAARSIRWAACAWIATYPAVLGCAPTDRVARQDVESLQTNVQQMESNIQARQAGVYEQIRDLREEQNRLARLIEDNGRQTRAVGDQVVLLRDRTKEELESRDKLGRDSVQVVAEQASRLGARLEGLQKDLQKGFETINENLVTMSAFEKKQEERIARIQEQLQGQLKVVVEEVGKENQSLSGSIAAIRTELDAARQESAASRQAMTELQGSMVQIAERLAAAQGEIQDLSKRGDAARDAARKAAPARVGQHTIRAGETLTTIAARYGISVKTLMETNRITDANSIREGQKLTVPGP
jgi:LysM repeat protein